MDYACMLCGLNQEYFLNYIIKQGPLDYYEM